MGPARRIQIGAPDLRPAQSSDWSRFRPAESDVSGDRACSGARGPLAALLFGGAGLPAAAKLSASSASIDAFSLINDDHAESGCAELLRDGLIFDIAVLAGGTKRASARGGMPRGLTARVQPGRAGGGVVPGRLASGRCRRACCPCCAWQRAFCVICPSLKGWRRLSGGRADRHVAGLVCRGRRHAAGGRAVSGALARTPDSLRSEGLAFLIGQKLTLWARESGPSRRGQPHRRSADGLAVSAHGRVDTSREAVMAGVGAVWLEPGRAKQVALGSVNLRAHR